MFDDFSSICFSYGSFHNGVLEFWTLQNEKLHWKSWIWELHRKISNLSSRLRFETVSFNFFTWVWDSPDSEVFLRLAAVGSRIMGFACFKSNEYKSSCNFMVISDRWMLYHCFECVVFVLGTVEDLHGFVTSRFILKRYESKSAFIWRFYLNKLEVQWVEEFFYVLLIIFNYIFKLISLIIL